MLSSKRALAAAGIALAALVCPADARAAFVPWEPLTNDSWICYDPADPKLGMHPVNGNACTDCHK